jgi:putative protease
MPEEKEIGKVTHYYGHLSVGIVKLKAALSVGDTIHIKGHTTDITQPVDSIQIEHKDVPSAKKGDVIGLKVKDHVREHDVVCKVAAE